MCRNLSLKLLLVILGVAMVPTGSVQAQSGTDPRAEEVLRLAREAAGGEAKLRAVQSLTANAQSKRQFRMRMGEDTQTRTVESDVEYNFLMPDKYLKRESSEMMGMGGMITRTSGFNGTELIQTVESDSGELPQGMMMNRPQGDPARMVKNLREESTRFWLSWMLLGPPAEALQVKHAGEQEIAGARADVIEVTGAEGFAVRLAFDQQTHRLIQMRFKTAVPAQMMRFGGGGPGGPPAERRPIEGGVTPPEIEVEVAFSDFRPTEGISLPYKLRRTVNGEVVEETEFRKFKLNPSLKPDKFKAKS